MAGGKINPVNNASILVGGKAGQNAPEIIYNTNVGKAKYPSKAGRYGVTVVEKGRKEKRAT